MTLFGTRMQGHPKTRFNGLMGESITYTPDGGSGTAYNAVIRRDVSVEYEPRDDGLYRHKESELRIYTDDIANPDEDGKVTFDSIDWDIVAVLEKDQGTVILKVEVYELVEKTGEGHRRSLP